MSGTLGQPLTFQTTAPIEGHYPGEFRTTYTEFHGSATPRVEAGGWAGTSATAMRHAAAEVLSPGRPPCRAQEPPPGAPPAGGRPRHPGGRIAGTGGIQRFGPMAATLSEVSPPQPPPGRPRSGARDYPTGRYTPRRKYRAENQSTPLLPSNIIVREPIVLKGA